MGKLSTTDDKIPTTAECNAAFGTDSTINGSTNIYYAWYQIYIPTSGSATTTKLFGNYNFISSATRNSASHGNIDLVLTNPDGIIPLVFLEGSYTGSTSATNVYYGLIRRISTTSYKIICAENGSNTGGYVNVIILGFK